MTGQHTSSLPSTDTITRVTLDNGITVLVYENHAAQSVFVVGTLDAGSLFAGEARDGLATLTTGALIESPR